MQHKLLTTTVSFIALTLSAGLAAAQTQLLWGDTHLHTNISADAYIQRNTTVTADDSYRFAKGAPVIDALSRAKMRIDTPLWISSP